MSSSAALSASPACAASSPSMACASAAREATRTSSPGVRPGERQQLPCGGLRGGQGLGAGVPAPFVSAASCTRCSRMRARPTSTEAACRTPVPPSAKRASTRSYGSETAASASRVRPERASTYAPRARAARASPGSPAASYSSAARANSSTPSGPRPIASWSVSSARSRGVQVLVAWPPRRPRPMPRRNPGAGRPRAGGPRRAARPGPARRRQWHPRTGRARAARETATVGVARMPRGSRSTSGGWSMRSRTRPLTYAVPLRSSKRPASERASTRAWAASSAAVQVRPAGPGHGLRAEPERGQPVHQQGDHGQEVHPAARFPGVREVGGTFRQQLQGPRLVAGERAELHVVRVRAAHALHGADEPEAAQMVGPRLVQAAEPQQGQQRGREDRVRLVGARVLALQDRLPQLQGLGVRAPLGQPPALVVQFAGVAVGHAVPVGGQPRGVRPLGPRQVPDGRAPP